MSTMPKEAVNPHRADLDPGFIPPVVAPYDPAALTPEERGAMNERFWAAHTPGWRPVWMSATEGRPVAPQEPARQTTQATGKPRIVLLDEDGDECWQPQPRTARGHVGCIVCGKAIPAARRLYDTPTSRQYFCCNAHAIDYAHYVAVQLVRRDEDLGAS